MFVSYLYNFSCTGRSGLNLLVNVSNNGSNIDYDHQDILLHCRMVNKTG